MNTIISECPSFYWKEGGEDLGMLSSVLWWAKIKDKCKRCYYWGTDHICMGNCIPATLYLSPNLIELCISSLHIPRYITSTWDGQDLRYGIIAQLIFRQRTQEYLMNTTQSWESVTRYISLSFPWDTLWCLLMNFVSVFSLETRKYLISNITSKLGF